MKTVIFKFNGILYQDADKWKKSWRLFGLQEFDRDITKVDFENHIYGRNYKSIMEYLAGKPLSNSQVLEFLAEEGKIYRKICKEDKANFSLVCGARFLLNELKKRQIPCLLIILAVKENFNFYIKNFKLNNWFSREDIIYLGNIAPGKLDQDFYKRIVKTIKLLPEDCIVFEDTITGISAASKAGIGNIIVLASPVEKIIFQNIQEVEEVIENFHEFNRLLLRN